MWCVRPPLPSPRRFGDSLTLDNTVLSNTQFAAECRRRLRALLPVLSTSTTPTHSLLLLSVDAAVSLPALRSFLTDLREIEPAVVAPAQLRVCIVPSFTSVIADVATLLTLWRDSVDALTEAIPLMVEPSATLVFGVGMQLPAGLLADDDVDASVFTGDVYDGTNPFCALIVQPLSVRPTLANALSLLLPELLSTSSEQCVVVLDTCVDLAATQVVSPLLLGWACGQLHCVIETSFLVKRDVGGATAGKGRSRKGKRAVKAAPKGSPVLSTDAGETTPTTLAEEAAEVLVAMTMFGPPLMSDGVPPSPRDGLGFEGSGSGSDQVGSPLNGLRVSSRLSSKAARRAAAATLYSGDDGEEDLTAAAAAAAVPPKAVKAKLMSPTRRAAGASSKKDKTRDRGEGGRDVDLDVSMGDDLKPQFSLDTGTGGEPQLPFPSLDDSVMLSGGDDAGFGTPPLKKRGKGIMSPSSSYSACLHAGPHPARTCACVCVTFLVCVFPCSITVCCW